MAKYTTLRYYPQTIKCRRIGPYNYSNEINMIDWDDGKTINLNFSTPLPVIGTGTLEIRVQLTETIENPEVDIPAEYLGR